MTDKSMDTPEKPCLSIILATTSPFKKSLFERLQLAFTLADPKVDETPHPQEGAPELAIRLAQSKAEAGLALFCAREDAPAIALHSKPSTRPQHKAPHQIIAIGCDQVPITENGDILHKPGTPENAAFQLADLRGKSVEFHTAVYAIKASTPDPSIDPNTREEHQTYYEHEEGAGHIDRTIVQYRHDLQPNAIERYLSKEDAWHCAGSVMSESLGITLLSKIESSDPTALIGLPLIGLSQLLRRFDVPLP
jgi:septum formation protein